MDEAPIFVKSYDLMLWLLQRTASFPRTYRFSLGARIGDCATQIVGSLTRARHVRDRGARLQEADLALAELRVLVRAARDVKALSNRQYVYAAGLMDEVGRMLGGWQKAGRKQASRGAAPSAAPP